MSANTDLINQLRIEPAAEPRRAGWLWLVVLAALGLAGYFGWQWWQTRSLPRVEVTLPLKTTITEAARQASVLDASGYVVARQRATVSSEVTGKLTEVLVEEGMRVEEGQLLARLKKDTEQAQLALAQAQLGAARSALVEIEVQLADARRTLRRQDELMRSGLTTQAAVDAAGAQVEGLKARLDALRENVEVAMGAVTVRERLLDQLEIRAPFAGVVIAKAAQPGEMVSPISAGGGFTRTGICTIVDMDSLEIEVDVNEAYIQRVREGQPTVARLDAYPDWEIASRVIAIVPTADRQKASVKVRIGIDVLDPRILPEMGAQVRFLEEGSAAATAARETIAYTLPASAIARHEGSDSVFVVEDGKVARRSVRLGERRGSTVVVSDGVGLQDRVVIDVAAHALTDGASVHVETSN